jgi:hypothetical protein
VNAKTAPEKYITHTCMHAFPSRVFWLGGVGSLISVIPASQQAQRFGGLQFELARPHLNKQVGRDYIHLQLWEAQVGKSPSRPWGEKHKPLPEKLTTKKHWRCGSSGTALAQQAQGPESNPSPISNNKNNESPDASTHLLCYSPTHPHLRLHLSSLTTSQRSHTQIFLTGMSTSNIQNFSRSGAIVIIVCMAFLTI